MEKLDHVIDGVDTQPGLWYIPGRQLRSDTFGCVSACSLATRTMTDFGMPCLVRVRAAHL